MSQRSASKACVGDRAAWRVTPERDGRRAKCSFLLAVLASDTATPAERAVALWTLVDDFDAIAHALSANDLERVRGFVDEVSRRPGGSPVWSCTVLPDDTITDSSLIDGRNVRRVVIMAEAEPATVVTVAYVDFPVAGRALVTSEYTALADGAVAEVTDDTTGRLLGSLRLETGHARVGTVAVELPSPTRLRISIANESPDEAVLWYGATIQTVDEASAARSVAEVVASAVRAAPPAASDSVLTPVTGEPLTLTDLDHLTSLRGKFSGERIFIMGNGPSLNRTPLELLENDYVFGVNRISLLFERISWRPTFFTAFDIRVVPDNKEEFAALDVPYKFFSARYKTMLGENDNHFWYHTKGHYEGFEPCFEPTAPYSGFGGGGTIGIIAIELSYYMGFEEIYLIGTDVSYSIPETVIQSGQAKFGDGVKLELTSTRDDDPNHFDPRYFGKDKKWHNPNVREMKIGFARAASYLERRGAVLRNATVGGELDEVSRVDFESLF